ncbi:MAG: HDIG domain-containing protein [Nitrospirae bacterium]|nr:HDIG domain-containing protein [Nitrospirota bacterium]
MKSMKNGTIKAKSKTKISIDYKQLKLVIAIALLTSVTLINTTEIEHFVGVFSICLIAVSIMFMDIFRYRPAYAGKGKMLVLLGLLVVGSFLFGKGVEYLLLNFAKGMGFLNNKAIIYAIPVQSGAMLVSLLFDCHTAIIFSFIIGILGGVWQNDAFYSFYVFTGSIIAVFGVLRCRKRTDIVRGGLYLSSANVLSVFVISIANNQVLPSNIITPIIFAATSGFTIAAFVSMILPVLEYTFKVTTDITLLELLDLNQPLMRNLMINAPGTYHHSVIVGNLVEAAAEDIGVNPLLARVTAYYHDIGKMKMADYFIENQSNAVSKHEKLTPHMSSMILISHVKEGLDLAEEYKLPEPIKDIITQHHGTNIMTFFYQKAKEESSAPPKEGDYRYPGPKPQSSVAALVMVADAVEAASRVLKEPTPARITGLVEKIITNVLMDGQLNECDLTLKDVNVIKERFAYILNGIFHKRIEYPGFDFNKPEEGAKDKSNDKELAAKSKDKLPMAQGSNEAFSNAVGLGKS